MKCPHCAVEIQEGFKQTTVKRHKRFEWVVRNMICPNPECDEIIIEIARGEVGFAGSPLKIDYRKTVFPDSIARNFSQRCIDNKFWNDYEEACKTLPVSPKASAAMSRRCLQNILREKAKVKKGNLGNEIQQVIDSGSLPSLLSQSIDAVRKIGNFAAHPSKSESTGEIVDVEPGEAEWLLEVLENLMDFFFIQPQKNAERREALNKKLGEIGESKMK